MIGCFYKKLPGIMSLSMYFKGMYILIWLMRVAEWFVIRVGSVLRGSRFSLSKVSMYAFV